MDSKNVAFLGRGLLSPLHREGTDFVNGGGDGLLRGCVANVLGTRSASQDGIGGEIPWRQEFGSRLSLLRHRNLGAVTQELARFYIEDALERWEPRVVVTVVEVEDLPAYNLRRALVGFQPIGTNRHGNLVSAARVEAEVIV